MKVFDSVTSVTSKKAKIEGAVNILLLSIIAPDSINKLHDLVQSISVSMRCHWDKREDQFLAVSVPLAAYVAMVSDDAGFIGVREYAAGTNEWVIPIQVTRAGSAFFDSQDYLEIELKGLDASHTYTLRNMVMHEDGGFFQKVETQTVNSGIPVKTLNVSLASSIIFHPIDFEITMRHEKSTREVSFDWVELQYISASVNTTTVAPFMYQAVTNPILVGYANVGLIPLAVENYKEIVFEATDPTSETYIYVVSEFQ